ncbi:MAG: ferritin-like domain-containing protein [Labilithrix sp.]|nr:ferritin-like domain-containing protein [Labilithrix sp.]MCW5814278.1 ferritin-like domain-containing protein [Labilithrix sp.]
MNVGSPPAPRSPATALVALLLAIAGCVVFPLVAVGCGLFLRGDAGVTASFVAIGLGAVAVLVSGVLAIVALARGAGKAMPIVALALDVLSIPAGIIAAGFAFLFASSGVHGRPFRKGKEALRTPTERGDAWSADGPRPRVEGLAPEVRAELAEGWLADASLEHASVAAFGALALDLVALGAPPALVRRAHEAAIDEIEHARLCFALASAYAGRSLTAAPFPEVVAPRARESARERRRRVAIETAVDGCVGEGAAAAVARSAAAVATDPVVRDVLARIAREEQRHADFAWDVLAWCLAVGDEELRAAVEQALAARAEAPAVSASARDALAAHGRIDERAWRAARARVQTSAVDRVVQGQ